MSELDKVVIDAREKFSGISLPPGEVATATFHPPEFTANDFYWGGAYFSGNHEDNQRRLAEGQVNKYTAERYQAFYAEDRMCGDCPLNSEAASTATGLTLDDLAVRCQIRRENWKTCVPAGAIPVRKRVLPEVVRPELPLATVDSATYKSPRSPRSSTGKGRAAAMTVDTCGTDDGAKPDRLGGRQISDATSLDAITESPKPPGLTLADAERQRQELGISVEKFYEEM